MHLLLALAPLLQAQEGKVDIDGVRLLVYDADKGFTFRVRKDGAVELTAGGKTFAAASVDEFRQKHAEAVRAYGLDRHLGPRRLSEEEFDQGWGLLRRRAPGAVPPEDDFNRFVEQQRELMERLRRQFADPAPATPPLPPPALEFGLRVEPVGETLRDQLSLKEGEGVLVSEVRPGSAAAKAGLRSHDIVLRLDGKTVTDRFQFRADVMAAMRHGAFTVEILRGGAKLSVKAGE